MGGPDPAAGHLRAQHPLRGKRPFPGDDRTCRRHLAADLHATFPCNRIIALNGMSFDPTQAGYAFTGVDDPNVFALLTDFEQDDWNAGRLTDPTRPPWNDELQEGLPADQGWDLGLASTVAANPVGTGKRTGLAPQDVARLELRPDRAGPEQEELSPRLPQTGPPERPDPGRLRRRRRGGLRRAGQGAAPPIHVQVLHQEGQGQGQEEEAEEDHSAAAEEEGEAGA